MALRFKQRSELRRRLCCLLCRWACAGSLALLAGPLAAREIVYSIEGRFTPPAQGSVGLSGATTPFSKSTLSDAGGRFRFKGISEGTYTLSVFVPNRGEVRQTVVVSPSTADSRRRVRLNLSMEGEQLQREEAARVSLRSLSVPERARREYAEAQKRLEQRDVEAAEQRLLRAVELAPQYGEAWNFLGTIAYQTQRYPLAEERFRKALDTDSMLYPPLVNLGGVLLNLRRPKEALSYNRHAVLQRPGDALAHAQLGMAYLELNQLEDAEEHLRQAIKLDPAHFSHPQLFLADTLLRKGQTDAAAEALDGFVALYPDHPTAAALRLRLAALRNRQTPADP